MNASYMTYHIARGIMLKAALNDLPGDEVAGSKAEQAWNAWCAGTTEKIAAFVSDEAFALFDRVNNAMHDRRI